MKKIMLFILLVCAVCASVSAQQQKPVSLEQAVTEAAEYLKDLLGVKLKSTGVGFADRSNPVNDMSRQIMIELEHQSQGSFPIIEVDSQILELLEQEIELSMTGWVDTESEVLLGHWVGGQFYVMVEIIPSGGFYILRMRVAHAESRERVGSFIKYFRKNNFRLSLGGRLGISPHFYTLSSDISGDADNPSIGFEPALLAAFHFTDFIALQTEISFSHNKVSYSGNDPEEGKYTASLESSSLQIPLLARFTLFPKKLDPFSLGVLGGIGFNIPLGAVKSQSSIFDDSSYRFSMPVSYVAGINPGLRIKSKDKQKEYGMAFADIRFIGDIGKTVIHDSSGTLAVYTRNTVIFSLGYEYKF